MTRTATKTYIEYQVNNPTGRTDQIIVMVHLSKGAMVSGQPSQETQEVAAGGTLDSTLQVMRGSRGTAVALVDGKRVTRLSF